MTTQSKKIDVHHHFLPPEFMADLARQGLSWTGGPRLPEWNLAVAREVMDRNGIATAVASVVPQVYWGDLAAARHWSRHANEFVGRAVADEPRRFGGFATLPLPDVEAACAELEHALDVLELDGVLLMASQGVQYLGDPDYEELFQELERRRAVVFIHPNTAPPGSIVPRLTVPWGVVEFVFDTTRAITNLLFSGTLERYPSIRYIVSHAGGAVPYLAGRIELSLQHLPGLAEKAPRGALHYLRRLYYDTALSVMDPSLAALRRLVPDSQILFGSDYPLVPEEVVRLEVDSLATSSVLDEGARSAIDRGSALALFPRFAERA